MRRVTVSIVICTRNRAEALKATLISIGLGEVPDGLGAELIVVDNGSTDGTRQVVASAHVTNMPVQWVDEPTPGLSRARNRGVVAAQGEVILFTDDDVRVPAHWIARMCEPILGGKCDATVGGISAGPGRSVDGVFLPPALFDPASLVAAPILIGANMAFHRRVLEALNSFETDLGAGALGMGEDTLFSFRAERAGFRILEVHDATVEHWFELDRCDDEVQRKTARQLGRAKAYMDYHFHRREPATTWLGALKSWWWLVRLQLRRARQGLISHPLTGWELHQLAEVAYRGEQLKQRFHSQPKYPHHV